MAINIHLLLHDSMLVFFFFPNDSLTSSDVAFNDKV